MAWDKKFLKKLFKLGGPIMLQNLFTVLGNSVTTFMTGRLGDFPIYSRAGSVWRQFRVLLVHRPVLG